MSSEKKTNEINTLILRKIADKFKIPHEKLSILAESEKNSSDKYLEMYTLFFKKIFKPDAIKSDSVINSKNLLDTIEQLFSGTIDLSSVTKGKSPPIDVNPTGNSGNGNATQISLVTTTGNSVVGNGNAISSSVSISTETDPIVDKQSVSTVKKTSTLYTGDNVVIETKFDKIKSTKYLNYNANTKNIIMSENPKK